MRSYEYLDPSRVLEIRGEDCTNCMHLGEWEIGKESVTACDNSHAPSNKRDRAPSSRCIEWRHKKQDDGNER